MPEGGVDAGGWHCGRLPPRSQFRSGPSHRKPAGRARAARRRRRPRRPLPRRASAVVRRLSDLVRGPAARCEPRAANGADRRAL